MLVAIVLLVAVASLTYQAGRAVLALRAVKVDASAMQAQLATGDFVRARRTLAGLTDHAAVAEGHTDGSLWGLAVHLPLVGDDLGAVRTVASVVSTISRSSLPSAITLARAVDEGAFRPTGGQFDLAAIERLQPSLGRADTVVGSQAQRLRAIDDARLLPSLRQVVGQLQAKVATAATAADASSRAVRLLPGMLGRDGPRSYLLVVQNNAEIRATGGLPGSFSVLEAENGKVTMGFQGASEDVGGSTKPALRLTEDEQAVYGDTMARDVRDANLTPDFPRAAALMGAMFEARRKTDVSGVLAVDPQALARILSATGPVRTRRGETLSAEDVVSKLLNDTYARFDDPKEQNDYFAEAARAIFDALMAGTGDQQGILRGLARAGGEHRLLLWSADTDEQEVVAGSAVAGEVTAASKTSPHVGLYLNDATGAKLQYYLDYRTSLTSSQCTGRGQQSLEAAMLLESKVPQSYRRLSKWILGFGTYAPVGSMRMNLRVYAPAGGSISQVTVDSRAVPITSDTHEGRQVAAVPLLLAPGQKVLVSATIRSAEGQDEDAVLDVTPGMRSTPNGVRVRSACR